MRHRGPGLSHQVAVKRAQRFLRSLRTPPAELERPPGREAPRTRRRARAPVIEIDDVRKTYRMGDIAVHALRGVSLRIERGEYVAIIGASGSGKTTLMNILGCLDAIAISGLCFRASIWSRVPGR